MIGAEGVALNGTGGSLEDTLIDLINGKDLNGFMQAAYQNDEAKANADVMQKLLDKTLIGSWVAQNKVTFEEATGKYSKVG